MRSALLALLALTCAARAQEPRSHALLGEALADLREPLDSARRERGLRRLLHEEGGAEVLRVLATASRESAEVHRLAARGLALFDAGAAASRWCELARAGPRRARREAALRLAFDASAPSLEILCALAGDPYDDVRAAAFVALRARAAEVPRMAAPAPAPDAYAPFARAWVALLPWHDPRVSAAIAALREAALAEELYRRIAREGLPAGCGVELLGPALGPGKSEAFDRRLAIEFLSGEARGEVDLFAPLFESEAGADVFGELDRAVLLRCAHAGARLVRPVERVRHATRDRLSWLLPVWPWLVERALREQILREHLNGPLAEDLAQTLAQDPELESFADLTVAELYRSARSSAVRGHLLRAALRLPQHFTSTLAEARNDEEALLREPAIAMAIADSAFDLAVSCAERETTPVVQVRIAASLGAALESSARGGYARELALRWAQSEAPATRRLALHLLLALEPDDDALRAARELWARTPLEDGERSDVHALLARFPAARAEVLAGLAELAADDAGRARDRVAELDLRALALQPHEEAAFALPVRGELAARRALRGDATAAAFLREQFEALPEELALRALDALAAVPDLETWRFFERLREAGRFDADLLLESAAPLRALPEVDAELRRALRAGDPQLRQAALRGLGRAGSEGQRALRELAREEFSSGDFTAWIEALDISPESSAALADGVVEACASAVLGGEGRLRPDLSRALLRLGDRGARGDRALEEALSRALQRGAFDAVSTSALHMLVLTLEERAPSSARRLAEWALATGEPEAEVLYRTALLLAADPARERARALVLLSLWLSARDELEAAAALASRDLPALDLAEGAEPSSRARVLQLLAAVEDALSSGAEDEARARFAHAVSASFFDARARHLVQGVGARHAALREAAEKELRRWSALGYAAAPAESSGPLKTLEARLLAPR
ncbi:MAG: hypothetical protein JNM84_20500 [Planctomycetes bacterium]|nr:hypothetical protein [Planctomycetota bacterium]